MAFATTGSLFDKQSDRIQEVLNKNIELFLPALDPAWRDTFVTSQGVVFAVLPGCTVHVPDCVAATVPSTVRELPPSATFNAPEVVAHSLTASPFAETAVGAVDDATPPTICR